MRLRLILAALVAALALGAGAVAGAQGGGPVEYAAKGGTFTGVNPTAVGLPQLGTAGTYGAGDMVSNVRDYYESGRYMTDFAATAGAARAYLEARFAQQTAKATRTCKARYVKTRRKLRGKRLFRKAKRCKTVTPPRLTGKPAIVLDIDETSLSNYRGASAGGFTAPSVVADSVAGTGTALAPTLDLFKAAKAQGVAVFFITGRPEALRSITERNLRAVGFDGWDQLILKPGGIGTLDYKAGERKKLVEGGFDVIANVGDQESDLDGGFADRGFKLPNPFYFIAD